MNLKKYYSAFNKTELKKKLKKLEEGCENRIRDGWCCYYTNYTPIYCNRCARRIKIIKEMLGELR